MRTPYVAFNKVCVWRLYRITKQKYNYLQKRVERKPQIVAVFFNSENFWVN